MQDVSVVLAHGAWADGSSWARVIAALKEEAVKVSAAPLPLTSLADDVAALNRSLDRTEGPIVLAGHAYAGAVIALARPERVKALVYVTALAPDEGEKVADVFYRLEPHPQAPKLAPDGNGLIWLPDEAFAAAFAQNASADQRAVLAAVQRPISINCITVPVGRPLWKDIPSWFLVAEDDRMIVPETQRYMAERMKAKIKGACRRSHAQRHRASDRRRHYPRCNPLGNRQLRLQTEEDFVDACQIPHGRCRWLQDFLSRSGTSRCAEAAAIARLPERGSHVPRSDPAPRRQISHRRAGPSRVRPIRHAAARKIQIHIRQHCRRDRPLHRGHRLRPVCGLCL